MKEYIKYKRKLVLILVIFSTVFSLFFLSKAILPDDRPNKSTFGSQFTLTSFAVTANDVTYDVNKQIYQLNVNIVQTPGSLNKISFKLSDDRDNLISDEFTNVYQSNNVNYLQMFNLNSNETNTDKIDTNVNTYYNVSGNFSKKMYYLKLEFVEKDENNQLVSSKQVNYDYRDIIQSSIKVHKDDFAQEESIAQYENIKLELDKNVVDCRGDYNNQDQLLEEEKQKLQFTFDDAKIKTINNNIIAIQQHVDETKTKLDRAIVDQQKVDNIIVRLKKGESYKTINKELFGELAAPKINELNKEIDRLNDSITQKNNLLTQKQTQKTNAEKALKDNTDSAKADELNKNVLNINNEINTIKKEIESENAKLKKKQDELNEVNAKVQNVNS